MTNYAGVGRSATLGPDFLSLAGTNDGGSTFHLFIPASHARYSLHDVSVGVYGNVFRSFYLASGPPTIIYICTVGWSDFEK